MSNALENVVVVLVHPRGPLNVGSVARAMKNFGLSALRIVGDLDVNDDECRRMAAHSTEILDGAAFHEDLPSALQDVQLAVATTARSRHRVNTVTPASAAPEILAIAAEGRTAIVFGREDHGLFKEELALCHRVLSVPTSAERTSINLAQAVLLVAYELFSRSDSVSATAGSEEGDLMEGGQWQRLYDEVLDCCEITGYTSDGTREPIRQSFRRLLTLGPIQTRDARHLFGLVRRVGKLVRGEVKPRLPERD